jgi:molybdate transport system substrate-binding protein
MRMTSRFILVATLLLSAIVHAQTLAVSVAISMKEALGDAAKSYQDQTGQQVALTFGSSGQLEAQIKTGAPVDLFISAANKQVDDLIKLGLADPATRQVIAGNDLALVVPPDAKGAVTNFDDLKDPSVGKIAIGEPKTVPAGQYAMQTLTAMKLYDAVSGRLVFGSNVRQVLDYVQRGEVAAGIVYSTDAKQAGKKVKVVAVAAPSTHEPIVYPAVVIQNSRSKEAAGKFLAYLQSPAGQAILAARGFTAASSPPPTGAP